jgi:hypothetical protein
LLHQIPFTSIFLCCNSKQKINDADIIFCMKKIPIPIWKIHIICQPAIKQASKPASQPAPDLMRPVGWAYLMQLLVSSILQDMIKTIIAQNSPSSPPPPAPLGPILQACNLKLLRIDKNRSAFVKCQSAFDIIPQNLGM